MFFHKGILALDIDGTITAEAHSIDPTVVSYLASLPAKGWSLIFITGRPFEWGFRVLQQLPIPFAFAVQNGALTLEMPSRKVLDRRYLTSQVLPLMEKICQDEKTDFVVYAGYDYQDWCYYRPTHFDPSILEYVLKRTTSLQEKWQPLSSFKDLPVSRFSSLKCFAKLDQAQRLSQRIEKELKLHAPVNKDPFNPNYYVIQATHPEATKGITLQHYKQLLGLPGITIAAGDDYNDLTLLQSADIKVVMQSAPSDLRSMADIIAPPAIEKGIIEGLQQALCLAERMTSGGIYD